MTSRSEGDGASLAIIIMVVILLLIGGGGAAFLFMKQQLRLAQEVERARAMEMEARMQAEQAQALIASEKVAEAGLPRGSGERAGKKVSPTDNSATPATAPATASESVNDAVMAVLKAQETAWNLGRIEAFMDHYWKSEDLTFSSGGNTTRGWTNTLERYRTRYPTPEKMGHVRFTDLEVTSLGDAAALVLGRWHVDRDVDPLQGNFSIVLRKIDGRWLIVHDHTSRLEESK